MYLLIGVEKDYRPNCLLVSDSLQVVVDKAQGAGKDSDAFVSRIEKLELICRESIYHWKDPEGGSLTIYYVDHPCGHDSALVVTVDGDYYPNLEYPVEDHDTTIANFWEECSTIDNFVDYGESDRLAIESDWFFFPLIRGGIGLVEL